MGLVSGHNVSVMDQDGTVAINQLGGAISAVGSDCNWSQRLDIFARRCAASGVDLLFISIIGLLFFGAPLATHFLFDAWQSTTSNGLPLLGALFDNCLSLATATAVLTQLYFYTALSESSSVQASLGKILFGLRTCDSHGKRQTFAGVIRRLTLKYALLAGLIVVSDIAVNVAAEFISTLQFEQFRSTVKVLILLASFTLCLVEEKEQNLYDILTGRLVVADESKGPGERWHNFCAALRANLCSLNPALLLADLRSDGKDFPTIVRTVLTAWAYVSTLCLTLTVFLASMLANTK